MVTNEERLNAVIEKLDLLEKHIKRHWVEREEVPVGDEVKVLQEELELLVKELKDIQKEVKVFKSW